MAKELLMCTDLNYWLNISNKCQPNLWSHEMINRELKQRQGEHFCEAHMGAAVPQGKC